MNINKLRNTLIWIFVLIIVSGTISFILYVNSNQAKYNMFFSNVFANVLAGLVTGLIILVVSSAKQKSLKDINDLIAFTQSMYNQIKYCDDYINFDQNVENGFEPFYEYHLAFDSYIKMIDTNISICKDIISGTNKARETIERESIKGVLRLTGSFEHLITKYENKQKDLVDKLKNRKKAYFRIVGFQSNPDLLNDPNFIYTKSSKYESNQGYKNDKIVFEDAERLINEIGSKLIRGINDFLSELYSKYDKSYNSIF